MLSLVLLSLIQSVMVTFSEYFRATVILYGPSQVFKTSLAKAFFCFDDGTKITASFESTKAAVIRKICNVRDAVALVDDCKPPSTASIKRHLIETLETIIRLASDSNEGYERAGPNGKTIAIKFRGLVCISAEDLLIGVGSSIGRSLILDVAKGSVNIEKLTYHQKYEIHARYISAITHYISYISKIGVENFCRLLLDKFLQNRNTLRQAFVEGNVTVNNRTNDAIVFMRVAYDAYLQYALEIGAIDTSSYKSLCEEAYAIFHELMEKQALRVGAQTEIRLLGEALAYLLDTKEVTVEPLQSRNVGFEASNFKQAIGFKKNGFVYLKNNFAYQHVIAFYKKSGRDFPISETTLRKQLSDGGYLEKHQKSYIHRLYVSGHSYQCIVFREDMFKKLRGDNSDEANGEVAFSSNRLLRENAKLFLGE